MLKRVLIFFIAGLRFATAAEEESRTQTTAQSGPKPIAAENKDPIEHCEYIFETGIIWKLGGGATPLAYTVMPQILTIKLPAAFRGTFAGGDLILRQRFSLLLEPIIKGPETHYLGVSGSGSIEWWNHPRTTSVFFASGGGFGGMNSKGYEIKGAQGQDLNFNWFIYSGAQKSWNPRLSTSLGLYFQHISNASLDRVNPGLNALGPMIGLVYRY